MIHLTQYGGLDSIPRYGTPAIVMKAKVDLSGHLPNLLSPRHAPETP
uniref:Uncharacterized protein n=1 Tax=Siphoviridae sp. ctj7f2 TaxID=2823593 RepID=A0A8S5L8S0_9CAUD|nr:MAG TPA: hypothetical protein [Siphoviridae sp. ctj7f2]